jgi:hypothetical protein
MVNLCYRCRGSRVETVDQAITCVALEGGPCFPCSERKAIREKIEQLEEEIAKLEEKHRALGGRTNEIHDPFVHKFPAEIGSHIFRLSLPTVDFEDNLLWRKAATFTRVLRLGAVCQRWRELAWATPDLWDTLYLKCPTLWMKVPLVQSLPGLLREWLSRSGMCPLTIFFRCFGRSEEKYHSSSYDEISREAAVFSLESVADLVIEVINLHSGRWQNLHLNVPADISERLCGSVQPNQLLFLDLGVNGERSPTQKFIMKSKPFPTQLSLNNFSPTSIDIGWDNITRAILYDLSTSECLEVLQRAPLLEYFLAQLWDYTPVNLGTSILHQRLRSLNYENNRTGFLEAINIPSLEEWTYNTQGNPLPVTVMVSLLNRSGGCLKILNLKKVSVPPDDLSILFEAMPSLERLQLHFMSVENADGIMDDILARIFNSPSGNSTISSEDASHEFFLSRLQFMECTTFCGTAPFSWNHIPQLYRQGHRCSLTLKSAANESHISDDTALELLKLTDEGVNLQILDQTTGVGGDFLENFRKKVRGLPSAD